MSSPALSRQVPARVTGSSTTWARDFALVGAASGFFALTGVFGWPVLAGAAAAGAAGAVTGALLGAALPPALDRLRGRVSIKVLALAGLPIGFAWGAATGVLASPVFATLTGLALRDTAILMALVGGIAGALQFGWLWFPYTFQTVRRGRRWPIVATACAATPALGWAAVMLWSALAAVV